jgi:superfamily I DNA and/or RNA helicase
MNGLNRIIAYWYDCIKNEDILEKDISIHVRKKAILYPFENDPFIFNRASNSIDVSENVRLTALSEYINIKGQEAYYGYPVLFYFNEEQGRHCVAPLLIIRVLFYKENNQTLLRRDEQYPSCGIQAFNRLGFRDEEIADINQYFETIFRDEQINQKELAEKCIQAIQEEVGIQINEVIDPSSLSNLEKLSKTTSPGLYNKSLIFVGENTVYNVSLLQDLLELIKRRDLENTSLSYLLRNPAISRKTDNIPLLPFQANEYQIEAIKSIFQNDLTVITGPPGTGKSQFISNLLINMFLQGRTVLFVSHTNEAVDVVQKKIDEQFRNLLLRTGRKEFRQELVGKFNELIVDSNKQMAGNIEKTDIEAIWRKIIKYREMLGEKDALEYKFENLHHSFHSNVAPLKGGIFTKLTLSFKRFILSIKLHNLSSKLQRYPNKANLEKEIRKLEEEYCDKSVKYIRSIYVKEMLGQGKGIGYVKSYLDNVNSARFDQDIDRHLFINAINVLKVWSSTLKSLRRTFPLEAEIFDYVVFDEASQVDLPSAAPALYRAKRAVIVGDPMQLTHVAGLTKDMDRQIAKSHGLDEATDVYPQIIRYCDVPLYKSSERCLDHKPIMLINHYRSVDQIISLCNQAFYKGSLRIATNLDFSTYPPSLPIGVHWIDCKGEVLKHPSGSRVNNEEAETINNIFQEVLQKISDTNLSIGIVTPYSRQQDRIYEFISKSSSEKSLEKHNVKVLTAHKFQGSEKDIMIFSLVLASRGNGNSDRWYNIYPQILNVALSRAKYLLYIVGDKDFCYERSGVLKRLVETYDDIKKQEEMEEYSIFEKFDTTTERLLFERLQEMGFERYGYKLIPKLVHKRYTLDFALIGNKRIDVECDGYQHELIEGLPVIEDVERDEYLEKEGWLVLRFPNHEILSQTDGVIERILKSL